MNQVTRFALLAASLSVSAVAQKVLFYETLQSREYTEATTVLGYDAHVATEAEWYGMTTADFAEYDAIILSDPPSCDVTSIQFAEDTKTVWSPAVGGNIIILGTDPANHGSYVAGAVTLIDESLRFAVNSSATGLYFAMSCYYQQYTTPTEVSVLSEIGDFTSMSAGSCYNDVHIVASSSAIALLSDADLSNWGCSIHEIIPSYPSEFAALAIANGATGEGEQTFADGSTGVPYIIARGVTPSGCGNGLYQPEFGEECDHGDQNGLDDDTCDITCKCLYGVDDADIGTCLPNPTPNATPTRTFTVTSAPSEAPPSATPNNATTSSGTEILTTSDVSTASTISEISSTALDTTTSLETELPSQSSTLEVITTPVSSIPSFPSLPSFTNSTFTPPSTTAASSSSSSSATANATPSGPSSAPSASSSAPSASSSTPSASSSASATSSSAAAAATPFPPEINSHNFLGCAGSRANYATFSLALASDEMDLELCVETCADRAFAGAYNTECYCADSFEDIVQLETDQCNLPCPGDATEHCGGSRSLARRQVGVPPETALLAVYVNPALIVAASGLTTATAVVTATATGATTVTATNAVSTTVVCVNGYCDAGYTFEICDSIPAPGEIVFVIESCSCVGGSRYVPAPCSGEACLDLTVYRPVPCPAQPATGVVVYQPKPCDECEGGVTFVQPVNTTVTTLVPATSARTVEISTATGTAIVVVAGGSKAAASIGSLAVVLGAFAFLI